MVFGIESTIICKECIGPNYDNYHCMLRLNMICYAMFGGVFLRNLVFLISWQQHQMLKVVIYHLLNRKSEKVSQKLRHAFGAPKAHSNKWTFCSFTLRLLEMPSLRKHRFLACSVLSDISQVGNYGEFDHEVILCDL